MSIQISSAKTGHVFDVTNVKALDESHGTDARFHEESISSTLSNLVSEPSVKFSILKSKKLGDKSIYRLRQTGDQEITYKDNNDVEFSIVVVCDDSGEGDFISSVPSIVYKLRD